jgi:hypothetical protein
LQNGGRGLSGHRAGAPALFAYMAIDYLLEKDMSVTRRRFTYVLILMIGSAAMLHLRPQISRPCEPTAGCR